MLSAPKSLLERIVEQLGGNFTSFQSSARSALHKVWPRDKWSLGLEINGLLLHDSNNIGPICVSCSTCKHDVSRSDWGKAVHFFVRILVPRPGMISDSREVEKHQAIESAKGVHVIIEPGALKSLQKLRFSPPPGCLILQLKCDEDENKPRM